MKSLIPLAFVLLALQGIAMLLRAVCTLRGGSSDGTGPKHELRWPG